MAIPLKKVSALLQYFRPTTARNSTSRMRNSGGDSHPCANFGQVFGQDNWQQRKLAMLAAMVEAPQAGQLTTPVAAPENHPRTAICHNEEPYQHQSHVVLGNNVLTKTNAPAELLTDSHTKPRIPKITAMMTDMLSKPVTFAPIIVITKRPTVPVAWNCLRSESASPGDLSTAKLP
jgi:hypothetical protein